MWPHLMWFPCHRVQTGLQIKLSENPEKVSGSSEILSASDRGTNLNFDHCCLFPRAYIPISRQFTCCLGCGSRLWKYQSSHSPAGTRHKNNVFITSKRRRWRRFGVMKTLSLRHYCVMCPLVRTHKVWRVLKLLHLYLNGFILPLNINLQLFVMLFRILMWSVLHNASRTPKEKFPNICHSPFYLKFSVNGKLSIADIWIHIIASWSWSMMTSSNGDIFRVTGPLWGEFTGHRWIPLTKASDAELWCSLWSAPE